jgi:hypothetical protein
MIMDAGSDSASSATRVVRLLDSRASEGATGVRVSVNQNREDSLNRQQNFMGCMLLLLLMGSLCWKVL